MDHQIIREPKFKPIEIKRAPEALFHQIEEMILTGQLKPDDKLPSERKLMEIYKRSHPTIRETLRLLESAGYIRVVPGDGSVINEFKPQNISQPLDDLLRFRKVSFQDIIEFMVEGEPPFAGYAASRRTWENIAELELKFEVMVSVLKTPDEFFMEMIRFHLVMIQAALNPLAVILWKGIGRIIERDRYLTIHFSGWDRQKSLELHRKLLDSIRNQQPESAISDDFACWESCKDAIASIKRGKNNKRSSEPEGLMGGFTPIRTKKVSEVIYDQILDMIISGELEPGEKLPPERNLINYFNRSRPSVREALKMLELKNYISISRGSGTVVNKHTTNELERTVNIMFRYNLVSKANIMEMRNMCETIAASWASQRRTQKDIDLMREVLDHSLEAIENHQLIIQYGLDFTNLMTSASKNEVLKIISQMTSIFSHERYLEKKTQKDILIEHEKMIRQHMEILEAIIDKNAYMAKELTLLHLGDVSKELI